MSDAQIPKGVVVTLTIPKPYIVAVAVVALLVSCFALADGHKLISCRNVVKTVRSELVSNHSDVAHRRERIHFVGHGPTGLCPQGANKLWLVQRTDHGYQLLGKEAVTPDPNGNFDVVTPAAEIGQGKPVRAYELIDVNRRDDRELSTYPSEIDSLKVMLSKLPDSAAIPDLGWAVQNSGYAAAACKAEIDARDLSSN